MTESDDALVVKSQKMDRAAFEELVRRTARLVYSRIYLDVADAHRAEDLMQETFMTAWKSIGQVTDSAGFRPWLLSIAHTTTVDSQRREGRKKRSSGRAAGGQDTLVFAADPGMDPSQSAEKLEERQRVLTLLSGLPKIYREPLMLRYIGGVDYETIGKQLGLSNGSLRGLLSRGMSRLREALTEKTKTGRSRAKIEISASGTNIAEEKVEAL